MTVQVQSSCLLYFLSFLIGVCHATFLEAGERDISLSFDSKTWDKPHSAAGVTVLDIDRDGAVEIVFSITENRENLALSHTSSGLIARDWPALTEDQSSTSAICWADYDADGDLDAYLSNQHTQANVLLSQRENMVFKAIEVIPISGDNYDCAWGDITQDGWPDLVVTDFQGGYSVLINQKGTHFTLSNAESEKAADSGLPTGSSSFVDFDDDGDEDVFITRPGHKNLMLENLGSGRVAVMSPSRLGELLSETALWVGASWADYDNDGDQDVFVTNLKGPNALYQNSNGRFQRVKSEVSQDTGQSWVGAWGDVNNDGHLDLLVSNFGAVDSLYLGNREGQLVAWSGSTIDNHVSQSSGAVWADLDDDGDLELVIANWDEKPNRMFYSNGSQLGNWLKVKLIGLPPNTQGLGSTLRLRANIKGDPITQTRRTAQAGGLRSDTTSIHFGLADATHADKLTVLWPDGARSNLARIAANQTLTIKHPAREE